MNEYEKIINIWIEKCAEYIWLHNQYILKMKYKNKLLIYQIIIISYTSAAFLLLLSNIPYYLQIITGSSSLYSGLLFTIYIIYNYKGKCEKHMISKERFICLFNELNHKLNISFIEKDETDFLLLKQDEFKTIIEQSPHIPYYIIEKFKITFKHLRSYKPYFQTKILLSRNPKEYRKTFKIIMYLTKYFHIWKTQYKYNKKRRLELMFNTYSGPFYNETKSSFLSLMNGRKLLNFQNIKLRNNNLEIKII